MEPRFDGGCILSVSVLCLMLKRRHIYNEDFLGEHFLLSLGSQGQLVKQHGNFLFAAACLNNLNFL